MGNTKSPRQRINEQKDPWQSRNKGKTIREGIEDEKKRKSAGVKSRSYPKGKGRD